MAKIKNTKKIIIVLAAFLMVLTGIQTAKSESLYVLGASQSFYAEPKSLFGSVRARYVGALVTIVLNLTINVND